MNDKVGVVRDALAHRHVLVTLEGIQVQQDHVVKNVAEAVDEFTENLGSVETHHFVDKAKDQLAKVDGGITEVDKTTVVDEITEISDSKFLHLYLNGCTIK